MKIIDKKEFVAALLNVEDETFVLHVAALVELTTMPIYSSRQAQVVLLTSKKTGILAKYSNFSNVFSSDSAAELPEQTGINNHSINLLDDKQSSYGLIFSLGLIELEMLKTYIKTNLASSFIRPFKSLAGATILFVWKKNTSLHLYIDYQGFNNLIIKNRYLLLLIGKSLDCLGCAKHFTQLNLTNAYHRMRIWEGNE